MCCSRALLTGWVLLLVQLLCLEAVPISVDKTKVKVPEKTPEEPPASVVINKSAHKYKYLSIGNVFFCFSQCKIMSLALGICFPFDAVNNLIKTSSYLLL